MRQSCSHKYVKVSFCSDKMRRLAHAVIVCSIRPNFPVTASKEAAISFDAPASSLASKFQVPPMKKYHFCPSPPCIVCSDIVCLEDDNPGTWYVKFVKTVTE